MPQAISVDASLTGAENLEFYARVTGVSRRERRARIDDAIETMGVGPFISRLARTLSGGMLRRLEIATALLNRPAVLFLDEPTVGLDPTARRAVWERLRLLRAEAGTTILVTTHQMEEADSECERVAIMDHGHLAALGTPAELREQTGESNLDGVFAAVTGHELDSKKKGVIAMSALSADLLAVSVETSGCLRGLAGSAKAPMRWLRPSSASFATTTSTSSRVWCSRCCGCSFSARR